jgi:hypothetical protein
VSEFAWGGVGPDDVGSPIPVLRFSSLERGLRSRDAMQPRALATHPFKHQSPNLYPPRQVMMLHVSEGWVFLERTFLFFGRPSLNGGGPTHKNPEHPKK